MQVDLKQLLLLGLSFIAFTIIGTLLHELGHITVAKIYGIDTQLHFGSMEWDDEESTNRQAFWISAGGPIQTMLFGTIGYLIILGRKQKIRKSGLGFFEWVLLFLGLFWLRQIFNLLQGILSFAMGKDNLLFGGDERYLSESLQIPTGSISILTALFGLWICCHLVFGIVPKSLRGTFILSGLLGGTIGFVFWMYLLGPIVLP